MKERKLSKLFSRERSLFYFFIWNDSDRLGFSKWLSYKIKNNLFLKEGKANKISVWYEESELNKMMLEIKKKINDRELMIKFKKSLAKDWEFILPILKGDKKIDNIDDFRKYYNRIISWWSVMTIMWYVPNLKGVDVKIKKEALNLRVATEKYSSEFNKTYENYFKKYFPEYKKFLHILAPKEIYILKDRKFTKTEIKTYENRLNGLGLFNGNIYSLDELSRVLMKSKVSLKDDDFKNVQKIKGTIASNGSGFVKGKVRLLLSKKSIKNFKKNEILVAEMTDPDFLSAIIKAAAIITDEGGITCHAAIVAREINKPCIIGTKIATRVLKDGDIVEVDMNKGVVKIIK